MRYLIGFMFVVALGALPLLGCGETSPNLCEGVKCDDDNECTSDVCDPASGTCDNTPVDDGTTCSDGACLDGICTALVTVSGTVSWEEPGSGSPAEGVMVSWFETALSTTTDASGRFSLKLPIGNLFLQTSKAGTWGQIALVWTEGASALELAVMSDEGFARDAKEFLGVDVDTTKGWVGVEFLEFSGLGGESATLSANGILMSDELPPGLEERWLDFPNVDPIEELTVTPRGKQGVNTCSLQVPGTLYPVVAHFATSVDVTCTPL